MTGPPTWPTISGTAAAAASLLTVTRTSSLPAACRAGTCVAGAAGSAVSVLVIDWTTIGLLPPTFTPSTLTTTVLRRWSWVTGSIYDGVDAGRGAQTPARMPPRSGLRASVASEELGGHHHRQQQGTDHHLARAGGDEARAGTP